MAGVLLDTDVFSFFLKRDTRREPYESHLRDVQVCLSFQTVAELRYWVFVRHWGEARRVSLEASIARCVVLPYDDAMTYIWAHVTDQRRLKGRPIACGDAWVAASSLRHNLPLLTHNAADYAGIAGLSVVSYAS
jgi:tRNA(fMet)-specific endonuclease VapC